MTPRTDDDGADTLTMGGASDLVAVAAARLAFGFERLVIRHAVGATHWDETARLVAADLAADARIRLAYLGAAGER